MKIANNCLICGSGNVKKSGAILMPFIADRVFDWKPFSVKKEFNLKTIKVGQVYSLCNSVYCNICHYIFLDIRFDSEEMSRLYSDYRENLYAKSREMYEPGYKKINGKLSVKLNYLCKIEDFILGNIGYPKTLLDWGGNNGLNTPFNSHSDILKSIYDISGNAVSTNFISIKNIEDLNEYDIVTCMHIFEHLPYPLKELKEIKKYIKKNGYIYIEVPYENIMKKRISSQKILESKKHWHEHINFFSKKSLINLLSKAGFKNVRTAVLDVNNGNKEMQVLQVIGSN